VSLTWMRNLGESRLKRSAELLGGIDALDGLVTGT
jgi:hypothetical protein